MGKEDCGTTRRPTYANGSEVEGASDGMGETMGVIMGSMTSGDGRT